MRAWATAPSVRTSASVAVSLSVHREPFEQSRTNRSRPTCKTLSVGTENVDGRRLVGMRIAVILFVAKRRPSEEHVPVQAACCQSLRHGIA